MVENLGFEILVRDRLVEMTIDRGRLVQINDQLQIDREYLDDSGDE